jgi:hypothetical protein
LPPTDLFAEPLGTTYYFIIRTRTDPHGEQQNLIDSDPSQVVSAN